MTLMAGGQSAPKAAGAIVEQTSYFSLPGKAEGVHPVDAVVFAAATTRLITIGVLANYFPARRAGRIAPVTALRNE